MFKAPEPSSGHPRLPAALFINPSKNLIPDKNPVIATAWGDINLLLLPAVAEAAALLLLPPSLSPHRRPGGLLSPKYAGTINIAGASRRGARRVR